MPEDDAKQLTLSFDALDFSQTIEKHSVNIAGHSTSITLEPLFWQLLKHLAEQEKKALRALIEQIDNDRVYNLSCAIRLYVMEKILKTYLTNS